MHVVLVGGTEDHPGKSGEVTFDLRNTTLAGRPWANQSLIEMQVRVAPAFTGDWARPHRARLIVIDGAGRRQYLPHVTIIDRPAATGGWLTLNGRPTADVPMPLGYTEAGFDPDRIVGLGINVEADNREGRVVQGTIEVRNLKVTFTKPVTPRSLQPDPAVLADEAERTKRIEARMRKLGWQPGEMKVGVNLPWPFVVAPDGKELQLYGRLLDAGERWYVGQPGAADGLWDLGHRQVEDSLRRDFREIRETFGPGAPVRLFLFADLRAGVEFDGGGVPQRVTDRASRNMRALLRMAKAEGVVLVLSLTDFLLADEISGQGPDGSWRVGEHPDLITDPDKRARLVELFESFVGGITRDPEFADGLPVLAWEPMNEAYNAKAVVNAEFFADLQLFLRDMADAIQRTGELVTPADRQVADAQRFTRGRMAIHFGQLHYWPLLETRPNPFGLGTDPGRIYGAVPAAWGESPSLRGRVASQLEQARKAGYRMLLFWSWRGDDVSGDGFAVRAHRAEIQAALESK
jgi:hypothetical protein